jgi:hypothetical protein
VKLHDKNARDDDFVLKFRRDLMQRQIEELKKDLSCIRVEFGKAILSFMKSDFSRLRMFAYLILLQRLKQKDIIRISGIHKNKLDRLYGGDVLFKKEINVVLNLSDISISEDIMRILSLGMNCHLKTRFDLQQQKLEVEKFYQNIVQLSDKEEITVENFESLKCELKRYGLNDIKDFNRDILSKTDYEKIKQFKGNNNIVIRKADKSSIFVILNKTDYDSKLNQILNDETKFKKINNKKEETIIINLKRKVNDIVREVNSQTETEIFKKLVGHYKPGYIYGNCKIHKDEKNPPLRPVISTIPTPTYEISKTINKIITSYMPKCYSVNSTREFIDVLNSHTPDNTIMGSLDVVSLFTNVPVQETIEIILKYCYHNPNLPPPLIPKHYMKALLEICTTESPFYSPNNDIYFQIDGVSMGCVLGPTMANFYMGHLEERVFNDFPNLKPKIYDRYIDDTFGAFKDEQEIINLKNKFEEMSCLKFTYELEKDKILNFLDVKIVRTDNAYSTSVFVKKTNAGDCLNYNSICPLRYKEGLVKTFLHRAYTICSDWASFHIEVSRIKQLLINNNFPQVMLDKIINNFINHKLEQEDKSRDNDGINLFFKGQMTSQYQQQEEQLRKIVRKNLKSAKDLRTTIYYKNRKLKNLLIRNAPDSNNDKETTACVVYQFTCPEINCSIDNQTYIGYTTNMLKDRLKQHNYKGAIRSHGQDDHDRRFKTEEIINNTEILKRDNDSNNLRILEALFIKERKPKINLKDEGFIRTLKIF